jgi:hypothetical protein
MTDSVSIGRQILYVPPRPDYAVPLRRRAKRSMDDLDYSIDMTLGLLAVPNDTVASVTGSTSASGLSLDTPTFDGSVVTAWISGGEPDGVACVNLIVTTEVGRTIAVEVEIMILPGAFPPMRTSVAPTSGVVVMRDGTKVLDITKNTEITDLSFASLPIAGRVTLNFIAGGSIGGVSVGAGGVVDLLANTDGPGWEVRSHS